MVEQQVTAVSNAEGSVAAETGRGLTALCCFTPIVVQSHTCASHTLLPPASMFPSPLPHLS